MVQVLLQQMPALRSLFTGGVSSFNALAVLHVHPGVKVVRMHFCKVYFTDILLAMASLASMSTSVRFISFTGNWLYSDDLQELVSAANTLRAALTSSVTLKRLRITNAQLLCSDDHPRALNQVCHARQRSHA
jgi:hypothetical protein